MTDSRWFRLNVSWSESDWLDALEGGPRLCWPLILGHVKAFGNDRGTCPAPNLRRFAAGANVPLEWIEALVAAATADGALEVTGGRWTLTNWAQYQTSGSTERVRRHRETKRAAVSSPVGDSGMAPDHPETPCNVTSVSETVETVETARNVSLSRDRDNDKDSSDASHLVAGRPAGTSVEGVGGVPEPVPDPEPDPEPDNAPKAGATVASDGPFALAERCLTLAYTAVGTSPPTREDVERCLKPAAPVQVLIREYGPERAAELFVKAWREWTHRPTWKSVCEQRRQLAAGSGSGSGGSGGREVAGGRESAGDRVARRVQAMEAAHV